MLFNIFRKFHDATKESIENEKAHKGTEVGGANGMVVHDVFSITGRGTVATGRVKGTIHINDSARLVRDNAVVARTTILGIEAFRKTMDVAQDGDNVGLLLKDLKRDDVKRWDCIEIE